MSKLTLQDGRKALRDHAREKGREIRGRYGPGLDYPAVLRLLGDDEFVRFPTRLRFDAAPLEPGLFGIADPVSDDERDGYVIHIHPHFESRPEDLPHLILYHLVTVNYGDFATAEDAEAFAAAPSARASPTTTTGSAPSRTNSSLEPVPGGARWAWVPARFGTSSDPSAKAPGSHRSRARSGNRSEGWCSASMMAANFRTNSGCAAARSFDSPGSASRS